MKIKKKQEEKEKDKEKIEKIENIIKEIMIIKIK